MSPSMWLMVGNMAVWFGFGVYAYILLKAQRNIEMRLARLESTIKESDEESASE